MPAQEIETRVLAVLEAVLLSIARAHDFQLLVSLDTAAASPQRIAISCEDQGNYYAVKSGGRFARKLEATITLHADSQDIDPAVFDAIASEIAARFDAMRSGAYAPPAAVLAPFAYLVIPFVDASHRAFDKTALTKAFTVPVQALLTSAYV